MTISDAHALLARIEKTNVSGGRRPYPVQSGSDEFARPRRTPMGPRRGTENGAQLESIAENATDAQGGSGLPIVRHLTWIIF